MTGERPDHIPTDRVVAFDVYASPPPGIGLHEHWAGLRAYGPGPLWTPLNGGHWIATDTAQIREILEDYDHFSTRILGTPRAAWEEVRAIPSMVDPPHHRDFRMLLNKSLSPRAVEAQGERIRRIAGELIEKVRPKGGCDFIAAYANQFPIQIFMAMIDCPIEDAGGNAEMTGHMLRPEGVITPFSAFQQIMRYVEPFVEQRMANDSNDLIGEITRGMVDGRPITKDEAVRMAATVMTGGLDTVVNFLGFLMLFLARNPAHRRQLIDEPELMPAAVDELFRRYGIAMAGRLVTDDVDFHGTVLREGEMIVVPTWLTGLDEALNADAMAVDFRRAHAEHYSFGSGNHRCPGSSLARREVAITIQEWLKRIPDFELAPDHQVRYRSGMVSGIDGGLPLVWDVARSCAV